MPSHFYAVARGRAPGVYRTWTEAKEQVDGFAGARYKKFPTRAAAEAFVHADGAPILAQLGIAQLDIQARPVAAAVPAVLLASTVPTVPTAPACAAAPPAAAKGLVCFTDGSAIGNGTRHAKAGYAVVWPQHPELDVTERLQGAPQTNNRAEYMGAIRAMEAANRADAGRGKALTIYTDSKLLVKSMTEWFRGWKTHGWRKADGEPVANVDLLQKLDEVQRGRVVLWKHVRAHTGRTDWASHWNAVADARAREGALLAK